MRIFTKLQIWLFLLMVSPACSMKQMALETTAELLADASKEMETESNWVVFRESTLSLIKTIEGLHYVDPTNEDILRTLAKSYGAYAYGVFETLFLNEKFGNRETDSMKKFALEFYSRSLKYGTGWLSSRGVEYAKLAEAAKTANQVDSYLNSHFDHSNAEDLDGIFFLAQSWMSYINLQRDKPSLVAQVYVVKSLFDWVCLDKNSKDYSEYRQGLCPIFYASYEASRPKMLGGDPEKGRAIFEKAMVKYPKNLLLKIAFLEYYVIPHMDQELYEKHRGLIDAQIQKMDVPLFHPGQPIKDQEGQNIYNAIAFQRYRIIRQNERNIF